MDESHEVAFALYYGLVPNAELQILTDNFKKKSGHLNYNVDNSGFYTFCLQQSSANDIPTVSSLQIHQCDRFLYIVVQRIKMMINYGYDIAYYEKLAKTEAYDGMDVEIRKLNDLLAM
jgi:hypothetical protein